jgi:hypothetical protein
MSEHITETGLPPLRLDVTPDAVVALRLAADNMPISRPGQPWAGAADWLRRRAHDFEVALSAREIPPAEGSSQNPVDGSTHPCPASGYAGRHTAVGAGAISPPYRCHGCGTWFVIPPAEGRA